MSAETAYIDSSAFVKLATPEDESQPLEVYLRSWQRLASSALLEVEVLRALRTLGSGVVESARQRLQDVLLIDIDHPVIQTATSIGPQLLRSLDAIHLATAQLLGSDLGVIVTYDRRLAAAAGELGLPVASPV